MCGIQLATTRAMTPPRTEFSEGLIVGRSQQVDELDGRGRERQR